MIGLILLPSSTGGGQAYTNAAVSSASSSLYSNVDLGGAGDGE